ncbi:Nucleoporin [Lachnellula cervina]|uniref:Nucleoporin n=1 Tax=Lachnellula cervina TaxID=1316786 RepID=A0A7D8URT9_9HELO|nr:Nucleoporin [Lachnellula cervina]
MQGINAMKLVNLALENEAISTVPANMSSLFRSATPSSNMAANDLSRDATLSMPPDDSISSLSWSPAANFLAVGSWDSRVRIYDVRTIQTGTGVAAIDFEGPVLACDWSKDGTKVAGAGADRSAKLLDLNANGAPAQTVSSHDAPIRSIRFFNMPNANAPMLATGSWDKSVRYWDLRQQTPAATLVCHDRVYAMDVKEQLLVIGTAEKHIHIVDLNAPTTIFETRDSPLKEQTRVVSCFIDASGFAVGSIEGRCGFQYIAQKDQSRNFAFRCHRTLPDKDKTVQVFTVNAISFHPVHGTFSSAGSDGTFHFWDKDAHNRLKGYPSVGAPISATAFNMDGTMFAYAVSYDWHKGYAFNSPQHVNKIMLHPIAPNDCKPRAAVTAAGRRR